MTPNPPSDEAKAASGNFTPNLAAYHETLLSQLDQRFLQDRRVRIALLAVPAIILIVTSVQFVHSIQETHKSAYRASGERQSTALGRWFADAEALANPAKGEDPYGQNHWFPTPPLVLMTLVPLTKLGYAGAGVVWAMLKIIAFAGAMWLLIRELGRGGFAVPVGVLVMTGLFGLRPIWEDMQHGNLNIFMMAWLALAWTSYMRGNDFWAGLFVALAIVTKVTPALLLIYFLYKRAWRVCGGAVVGLILVFVVVPGLFLGFGRNSELLRSWFDMMVAPYALQGYTALVQDNQALYAVFMRVLSNAGLMSIQEMSGEQAMIAGIEAMARPATLIGSLMRPAISLTIVGSLAWLCRTRSVSRRDPRLLLEFGAVLLAMLLLSERTWKHHATTLPIVFLGVWYALTCLHWSDRFRAWFVGGLVVVWLLLVGSSQGLVGENAADMLLEDGGFCWGLVLCFVMVGVLLRGLRAPPDKAPRDCS